MIAAAPVFYPTREEWYELPPMVYIERIREKAEASGICKIVPPSGWRPPFSLPSAEVFEFKTRVQIPQLIEGRARLRKEFASKLRKVLFLAGRALPVEYPATSPTAPAFAVDLLTVFRRICAAGGSARASEVVWRELAAEDVESLDVCKQEYERILFLLEERLLRNRPVVALTRVSQSRTTIHASGDAAASSASSKNGGLLEPFEGESAVDRVRRESTVAEANARKAMQAATNEASYARLCSDAARSIGGPRMYPVRPDATSSSLITIAPGVRFYKYFEDIKRCIVGTVTSVLPRQPGQADVVWRIRFRLLGSDVQGLEATHTPGATWDIEEESEDLAVAIQCGTTPEEATEAALRGVCQLCARANRTHELLRCGECKSRFHTDCGWNPIPETGPTDPSVDWFCPTCVDALLRENERAFSSSNGESKEDEQADDDDRELSVLAKFLNPAKLAGFGFDDGENQTLATYWEKENQVRNVLGLSNTKHLEGDDAFDEENERKYWDFVNGHYDGEDVDVWYGNDLDTSRVGSGFPRKSDPNLSEEAKAYAESGWNLNNLPTATGSLLQYLGADVSGIIVPWLYLGMTFSSFCWHVEDHNFCSINYHHSGAAKSWWGVPESQADAFETATRDMCPELFEARKDILQGIVTMFDPTEVARRGVKVFHLIQRPGDIVLTFPRGYHAGFNHGFNVAEAVNFASMGWLKHGKQAVARYASLFKPPVVSHEALVRAVAEKCRKSEEAGGETIETATAALDELKRLVQVEKNLRAVAAARGVHPPAHHHNHHLTHLHSTSPPHHVHHTHRQHGAKRHKGGGGGGYGRERQVLGGVFGDVPRCSECKRFCSFSHVRTYLGPHDDGLLELLAGADDADDVRCLRHAKAGGEDQLVESYSIAELEELIAAVEQRISASDSNNPNGGGLLNHDDQRNGAAQPKIRVRLPSPPDAALVAAAAASNDATRIRLKMKS